MLTPRIIRQNLRERREALGLSYDDLRCVGYAVAADVERGDTWGNDDPSSYERLLRWLEGRVLPPASGDRWRVVALEAGVRIDTLDDPRAANAEWVPAGEVGTDGWARVHGAMDPATLRYIADYAASVTLRRTIADKRARVEAIDVAQKALDKARSALAVAERDWQTAREDAGLC